MLPVNILFFSTPAERGSWSMVQRSGGKAVLKIALPADAWSMYDCHSQNKKGHPQNDH